jgi:hypothetical protein
VNKTTTKCRLEVLEICQVAGTSKKEWMMLLDTGMMTKSKNTLMLSSQLQMDPI